MEYAQADYSNFGTDQYVGAEKTWTFEGITSDIQTTTTIIDALYLHSNNMNGRRFLSAVTSEGSVSFADGTVQPVSRTLTTATGANNWTVDKISDNTNASTNMQVGHRHSHADHRPRGQHHPCLCRFPVQRHQRTLLSGEDRPCS